jgi:hypothetical protein
MPEPYPPWTRFALFAERLFTFRPLTFRFDCLLLLLVISLPLPSVAPVDARGGALELFGLADIPGLDSAVFFRGQLLRGQILESLHRLPLSFGGHLLGSFRTHLAFQDWVVRPCLIQGLPFGPPLTCFALSAETLFTFRFLTFRVDCFARLVAISFAPFQVTEYRLLSDLLDGWQEKARPARLSRSIRPVDRAALDLFRASQRCLAPESRIYRF